MASPQIKDGYTKIANELLEALYQFNATGSQFRVMLFLIRNIYGYGKTSRCIATSKIINGTGMNKSQCIRTLNELKVANMITGRLEETKKGITYRIQKNYKTWRRISQKVASKRPKGRFQETKTKITPIICKEKRKKGKKFIPPSLNDVVKYFSENGYSKDSGKKAFQYYSTGDWKDSTGKPVKNWKQKMIAVWFKPENKIELNQSKETKEWETPDYLKKLTSNIGEGI